MYTSRAKPGLMRLNTTTQLSKKVFGDFNFIELTVPKDFVKIFRISVDGPRGTTRGVRAGHQLRFDKVFWDGQFDKIKVSEDFFAS